MSQFIELPKNMPLEAHALLRGILSKVVGPSLGQKQFFKTNPISKRQSLTNSQVFLKTKADKRFVQEIKLADQLQHIVISKQYETMKKNLNKYGRSKSSKIMNIVKDKRPCTYFGQEPQNEGLAKRFSRQNNLHQRQIKKEEKQAKLRYSIGNIYSAKDSNDRVVFVDRKYNKEFAIKRSSLIETEQIMREKENYHKFLSKFRKKEPLVEEAKMKRRQQYSQYEKEPMQSIGIFREGSSQKVFYEPKRKSNYCRQIGGFQQSLTESVQLCKKKPARTTKKGPLDLQLNYNNVSRGDMGLLKKKNKLSHSKHATNFT